MHSVLLDSDVYVREMINFFGAGLVLVYLKNFNIVNFLDTISVINVNELYSLRFTCSYYFQSLWPYFKITSVSNSLNWKVILLSC